ncbi:MAG: hypothetical protein ACH350_02230 [Parachlamydiaceae bacterium]
MNNVLLKIIFPFQFFFLFSTYPLKGEESFLTPPHNFSVDPKNIALHHPVKTNQNLAQLYFDQGLSFVYAFNQDAAYWSFKKAAEVDPNMAMAYWGMALALGPNLNVAISYEQSKQAYDLIRIGMEKAIDSPEIERDYIQSLQERFSGNKEKNQEELGLSYLQAMQKLHQKYPDDPDAAVLYAASLLELHPRNQWTRDGKPIGNALEAVNILQIVLRSHPDHTGANHYYIHAMEDSLYPEMALMSADRLRTLQALSGHMLHMSSHIYLSVGEYSKAIASNLDAIAADKAYIREYGMDGAYPTSYLSHNLYYLCRAYVMDGRFEDAMLAANTLKDLYLSTYPFLKDEEYYASTPLSVLITFHQWKNILELQSPPNDMTLSKTLWLFGRALAYASVGQIVQAKEHLLDFLEQKKNLLAKPFFLREREKQILDIAHYAIEAKIADIQGNSDLAIASLHRAIEIQDSLRDSEPPNWFYSTRIALGSLLLKLKKAPEAESVFRQELKRYPLSGRALFGLRESLKAQSKVSSTYWVNQAFQKAWQYSSISLIEKE